MEMKELQELRVKNFKTSKTKQPAKFAGCLFLFWQSYSLLISMHTIARAVGKKPLNDW
jgi:hypothetical protein